MNIDLYSVWKPVVADTGYGIILYISIVPERRFGLYSEDKDFNGKLYHFVTDFGNTIILTEKELLGEYAYVYTEKYPKLRLRKQLILLNRVQDTYFKDLED